MGSAILAFMESFMYLPSTQYVSMARGYLDMEECTLFRLPGALKDLEKEISNYTLRLSAIPQGPDVHLIYKKGVLSKIAFGEGLYLNKEQVDIFLTTFGIKESILILEPVKQATLKCSITTDDFKSRKIMEEYGFNFDYLCTFIQSSNEDFNLNLYDILLSEKLKGYDTKTSLLKDMSNYFIQFNHMSSSPETVKADISKAVKQSLYKSRLFDPTYALYITTETYTHPWCFVNPLVSFINFTADKVKQRIDKNGYLIVDVSFVVPGFTPLLGEYSENGKLEDAIIYDNSVTITNFVQGKGLFKSKDHCTLMLSMDSETVLPAMTASETEVGDQGDIPTTCPACGMAFTIEEVKDTPYVRYRCSSEDLCPGATEARYSYLETIFPKISFRDCKTPGDVLSKVESYIETQPDKINKHETHQVISFIYALPNSSRLSTSPEYDLRKFLKDYQTWSIDGKNEMFNVVTRKSEENRLLLERLAIIVESLIKL